MCVYSTPYINRKYTKNKKNGGVIPPIIDRRTEWVPVGCGNCIECRKEKQREWQVRLLEDIKTNTNGKMITLTFSNESIAQLLQHEIQKTNPTTGKIETITIQNLQGYEKDNAIATKATRLFNERWRRKYKKALRHWLVTELGHRGTENIHLHGIIWTDKTITEIEDRWAYGFIWMGYNQSGNIQNYVNGKTVNYTTKYISKVDQRNKEYKPKILSSPGIGSNYINTYNASLNSFNWEETQETYRTETGHKIKLPRYWRNKLYTDRQREFLWMNKLDQPYRFICGEKIDISKDMTSYNNVLQFHRQRNHQLGYGGKPNENRKEYEQERREALIKKRISNITPSAGS